MGPQGPQGMQGPQGTPGVQGPAGPGVTGINYNQIPKGNGNNPITASNCTVGGSSNADLACLGSIAAGDGSAAGAVDLFGTNGNAVGFTADPNTAAYTEVMPAAVPQV